MELSDFAPLARSSMRFGRKPGMLESGRLPQSANDHAAPRMPARGCFLSPMPCPFPSNTHAIIPCPAPSAMSSGRAHTRQWVLEFAPRSAQFIEPLMGWTGGADPLRQVQLRFPSREATIAYAQRHGLPYEVQEPTHLSCTPDRYDATVGATVNEAAPAQRHERRIAA